MKRAAVLFYGIVCYAVFCATFLYAIGFIGNLIVPKSIDSVPIAPMRTAFIADTLLLAVFALQHRVMARPFFMRAWARIVPVAAGRSSHVLFSSLALMLLFTLWQPIGGIIWDLGNALARYGMCAAYGAGWLLVLASTFAIDHCDLFGLRQTWCCARGVEYRPPGFRQPALYRIVRHPLYLGCLVVVWATPTMTIAHLLFAVVTTLYVLIAIRFEEHDLKISHPEYADYARRVPMLIPAIGRLFDRPAAEASK